MKFSPEVTSRINQWKENMTAMPTDQFLDHARLFLGEISTPFNKQNLVTQISTFFCQDENKKNIIALLGKNDLKIISLVKIMPEPTKKSVIDFFSDDSDPFSIRAHLQNLEERMILYTCKSKSSTKEIYSINPILEEALGSKIGMETLIEKKLPEKHAEPSPITLSPIFLASFISFCISHPELCKSDGSIKKKALKDFGTVCGLNEQESKEGSDFAYSTGLLVSAFRNLFLFTDKNGSFVPDWQRLTNFSKLPELNQYIYLCSGAFWKGHSRRSLSTCSQLLFDTLSTMQEFAYTRKMILHAASLIYSLSQDKADSTSRFEMLMAKATNNDESFSPVSKIDQLIDSCTAFGLMNKITAEDDSEPLYTASPVFYQMKNQNDASQKCVSVETGFSVTLMPGLPLEQILPLIKFMDIKRLDVAALFEINHKSVLRSFDYGMTLKNIEQVLETNSGYPIPQNLTISLEDWFNSYSSAALYHGYILRLNESNVILAEKNAVLSQHIIEKLSPTILLLDFTDDFEASAVILQSGLNFIGKVKTCSKDKEIQVLPFLRKNNFSFTEDEADPEIPSSEDKNESGKILDSLKECLEKMKVSEEQKEELLSRIERRIIINENQLLHASVPFDKTEASAMDNSGKMYIIDKAMREESLVEITMDSNALPHTGLPVVLDKKNKTVTIRKKNGNEMTLPVSAAVKVKKMRIKIDF